MELAKMEIHKQGLDGDPTAVLRDGEQAPADGAERAGSEEHPGAYLDGESERRRGASNEGDVPSAPPQDFCQNSSDSDKSDADSRGRHLKSSDTSISSKDSKHDKDSNGEQNHSDHGNKENNDIPDHSEALDSCEGADIVPSSKLQQNESQLHHEGTKTPAQTSSSAYSSGPPPLDINYEAMKHIATYFMPGSHGACVDVTENENGGSFHEIRILTFEDGWSCIGRFTRDDEPLNKTESELATIEYVRKHTKIPVPEIYLVNYDRNHVVGSAFVLMERLEGVTLRSIWDDLSLEHQASAVEEIAHIIGQLADLRFDRIGSLTFDGRVGPLLNIEREFAQNLEAPFATFEEFVQGALDENRRFRLSDAMAYYPDIKKELQELLAGEALNPTLQAPFRLVHDDLELWNVLVTREDELHPPKISGIIDWDWAFVGPLTYLCEYPPAITNMQKEPETYPDNKMLRQHFVKTIAQHFPKHSSDREQVMQCFREKSEMVINFLERFASYAHNDNDTSEMLARTYLSSLRNEDPLETHHPYGCYEDEWVPDSDPECDD